MVSTLVALCSQLGITAIAEGIENPEQLLWLQKLGCQEGQGFFFSKPLPPPDIEVRFLKKLHQKS
ncbi:MAG: EAL domain-containing protein [Acaryochloridaceae cyanobacterium RL_2_7]|nr:EAL domain-containing protein [Acaryochloridaceae cyanobacterium RL_2_7]